MAQTPSFAAGCARPAFRLVPDVPTLILAAQRAVLAGDALRGSAGMAIACGCGSQTSIQRCVVRWPPTLENSVGRSWNIFMATVGGYGDTLPLIPLGVALQQAGHAVTLVCVSFVAGVVYSYGLNPLPYHWETAEVLGHVLMKAWEGGDHHAQMEVISTWSRLIAEAAFEPLFESFTIHDAAVVAPMVQPFALEFRRKQTPCGWPECKHTPGQPTSHGDSHMGAPDSRRRLFNLLQGSRMSLDMVRALGAGIQKVSDRLGQRPLPIARQMAQFMTEPTFIPVSGYLAPAFADHPRGPATCSWNPAPPCRIGCPLSWTPGTHPCYSSLGSVTARNPGPSPNVSLTASWPRGVGRWSAAPPAFWSPGGRPTGSYRSISSGSTGSSRTAMWSSTKEVSASRHSPSSPGCRSL